MWMAVSPVPVGIFTLQEEKLKALEQEESCPSLDFRVGAPSGTVERYRHQQDQLGGRESTEKT